MAAVAARPSLSPQAAGLRSQPPPLQGDQGAAAAGAAAASPPLPPAGASSPSRPQRAGSSVADKAKKQPLLNGYPIDDRNPAAVQLWQVLQENAGASNTVRSFYPLAHLSMVARPGWRRHAQLVCLIGCFLRCST